MAQQKTIVEVEGRRLALSNLDKQMYDGFSKGQVIDYYSRIAAVLLPHIAGRPMTLKRYPDGVAGPSFFAKNLPAGAPDWVRRERLPTPGSSKNRETVDFVVVDDLPTLVWVAQLAAIELHTPQWRVGPRGGVHDPDQLVIDLDPGPPATIVHCCRVALAVRDALRADGLAPIPKTSGSKGLQVYAAVRPTPAAHLSDHAHTLARRLEREQPGLVVSRMAKDLRAGKVLLDWSQNNAAKTTVAPYSLRARPRPSVSTPLRWGEVAACADGGDPEALVFLAADTLERVERNGDLAAPLLTPHRPALTR